MNSEINRIAYKKSLCSGQFNFANIWYSSPPSEIDFHFHNCIEIYLFLEGDAIYSVEGSIYELDKNALLLSNMNELHTTIFKSNKPYSRKNITVQTTFLSSLITDTFNPMNAIIRRKPGINNKIDSSSVVEYGIDKLFVDIENALRAEAPESEFLVKLYLGLMLAKISKLLKDNEPVYYSDDRITNLIYYINENLSENLSYESLSKHFYINKSHLGFMFKRQTGIPLGEYIKHKRIIKAKTLLLNGMPALQVSKETGFNDYPTFYRMFKLLTGLSPRDFSK